MLSAHQAASHTFERRLRGYSPKEVEALRSRLVSALAESERGLSRGLPIGSAELAGATFSLTFRGYDPEEVDELLAEAARTLERRGVSRGRGHKRITAAELSKIKFRATVDGYDRNAVRRYLGRAAEALEAHHEGRPAQLTRVHSEAVEFPLRLWGWSCDDVEAVCDRVTSTLLFYEALGPVSQPGVDERPDPTQ